MSDTVLPKLPDPVDIVFVAYGGGHVASLLPVAKLAQDRGYNIAFFALTTAHSRVRASGITPLGYRDFMDLESQQALEFGRMLCPNVSPDDPVPPEESIAYHGINFSELVNRYGFDEAQSMFAQRGRQAFLPIGFFEKVLRRINPAVVVATNSPRSEQAAILAAGKLQIPAICVVDLFALQEVQWIGDRAYADRVCVLNESVKSFLLDHGRDEQQVVVTGNPAFDALTEPTVIKSGQELRAARGWNDGKLNVLWASQVEPETHPFADRHGDPELPRKVEAVLRQLAGSGDSVRVIVRYHPSERVPYVQGRNMAFSAATEPLHALLHAVDLVVVTASTVGLEAHLAGKPVISVDLSVFTDDAPYTAMGISKGVKSLDDLVQQVQICAGDFSRLGLSAPPVIANAISSSGQNVLGVVETLAFPRRSKP